MQPAPKIHRVALLAADSHADELLRLFELAELQDWAVTVAHSVEHTRFLGQFLACDVLLVDASALDPSDPDLLGWLQLRGQVPLIVISEEQPELIRLALSQKAHLWLPRPLALSEPMLLADALEHAVGGRAPRTEKIALLEEVWACRFQVTRLADMLWELPPTEGREGWFSQRQILERLREEVSRCDRQRTPLSLVLGEAVIIPGPEGQADEQLEERVRDWLAGLILQNKRRSDLAGQYGPMGFMTLLPLTEAEGAEEYCRRLKALFDADTCPGLPATWRVQVGTGAASYSSEHHTPKSLLRLAEEHLACSGLPGVPPPIRPAAFFGPPARNS